MVSGGALRSYRCRKPEGLPLKQISTVYLLVAMPYVFVVGWLIDLASVLCT